MTYLRKVVLPLLLTLLPLSVQAQRFAGSQCEDPGQSMLWRVESAGLQEKGITIHLFGSIHVGKPGFYPLPGQIESLVAAADNLVFEVNPETAADPQFALQMSLRGILPQGQSIDQVVSPETLRNLELVLRDMGLPLENFRNFKPWMIALLLTNLQAGSLGFDPRYGLESYLMTRKTADTRILELETLQQQLDMLETLDPELFLGYSLEEYSSSAVVMHDMVEAWLCGEKETLADIMFSAETLLADAETEDQAGLTRIFDKLFTERNLTMANGIEAFAQSGSGSYFVVVGSGHLLGEGSVVALLQQRGYEVIPVRLVP
jgi:uncharacterized protein YbaP (TraB family)